jgi:type II secretory pathway component GspD/PulD (secretin)
MGYLFGTTTKSKNRSELIILITPHVIQSHEKLQEMSQELKDSLRNVGKYVNEKDKEIMESIEAAQKDKDKAAQELLKEEEKKATKNEKK